jgi:hypothetical protein
MISSYFLLFFEGLKVARSKGLKGEIAENQDYLYGFGQNLIFNLSYFMLFGVDSL